MTYSFSEVSIASQIFLITFIKKHEKIRHYNYSTSQHSKALFFQDHGTSHKIMQTESPVVAKRLVYTISNLNKGNLILGCE